MAFSSAERSARYRAAHPGRAAAAVRRNTLAKRQRVWEYKAARGCRDCGETDPVVLELDHRDPTQKTMNHPTRAATNWVFFSWDKLEAELVKCDVRCANCHRRKTAIDQQWPIVDWAAAHAT